MSVAVVSMLTLALLCGAAQPIDGDAVAKPETPSAAQRAAAEVLPLVRQVDRQRGRRLDTLLRPSDDVLEVIDQQPYGMPAPPPPPGYPGYGKPELQRRVEDTPFIALVRVISQQGALSAVGDWIETTARCEVTHVFKAPPELHATGQVVSLRAPGGEVRIGRQRIRARHHSASYLQDGEEYLVWAWPGSGRLPVDDWHRLDGDALVSVVTGGRQDRASVLADVARYAAMQR